MQFRWYKETLLDVLESLRQKWSIEKTVVVQGYYIFSNPSKKKSGAD